MLLPELWLEQDHRHTARIAAIYTCDSCLPRNVASEISCVHSAATAARQCGTPRALTWLQVVHLAIGFAAVPQRCRTRMRFLECCDLTAGGLDGWVQPSGTLRRSACHRATCWRALQPEGSVGKDALQQHPCPSACGLHFFWSEGAAFAARCRPILACIRAMALL